ncbi:MAG TPA: UDP-N-acetylglucosamine-peptide N-acetylglucosaminyltransferase [Xanthomonadales bacterium]|nr:UDP-N-acetylglucosamine-peptide N-acetylglucosaminyltransferase [Xanthomonadales bacterium]
MTTPLELARLRLAEGDLPRALAGLVDALRNTPADPDLWRQLGLIYLAIPQAHDALACFQRCLNIRPDDGPALAGAAAACEALAEPATAVALYRRALTHAPRRRDLRPGLAAALLQAGDIEAASQEADRATGHDPDDATAWRVRGDIAMAMKQPAAAAAAFRRAAALAPDDSAGHYALGLAAAGADQIDEAIAAFTRTLDLDPTHGAALAQICHLKRRVCDWHDLDRLGARLRQAVHAGREGITPFAFLAETGDPAEQLACARLWAGQVERDGNRLGLRPLRPPVRRESAPIRIGFVSSGFGNHPTALLIAELIERLRLTDLITYGFATTPDDGGALRTRLQRAFKEFETVDRLGLNALAKRIRQADLDIVFDLRGYGDGAVSPIYAQRVAPIQVNWLAYPGSQGAAFMDYLLADRYVIPDDQRQHYAERLLRLPQCFQPSDSTRRIPEPPPRSECGLPEHGPVLACFNNSYKITPEVFDAWARIARAVPDACFWLLRAGPDAMIPALRREAAARDIAPERLIFMEKLAHPEYLARYRHADLFLDTWPYNAHTTASDALWAGCPVLTLPGRAFAARVAGSLLATLGLHPLIASDIDDYVARAIAIVRFPEQRHAIRDALETARRDSPLFDLRRYANDFVDAVSWMATRQRRGQAPIDHDFF